MADASIQEILARKARLICRIAKLRASFEAVHDAMAHLNALRSEVRSLRSENRARTSQRKNA